MCFGDTLTQKDKDDAQKDFDGQKDLDKYKNGPVQDRSCTDVFMCIIFSAFLLLMVVISIVGFQNGDPYKIVTPFDSDANICGESEGFEDYPYLFWPEFLSNAASADTDAYKTTVCVNICPKYDTDKDIDEYEEP